MSDRSTRSMDAPPTPAELDAAARRDAEAEPVAGTGAEQAPATEAQVKDPAAEQIAEDSQQLHPAAATGGDATSNGEVEVECPGCGMLLIGDSPRPSAEWFCPRCDYPVFWASPPSDDGVDRQKRARRRLPGTSGRAVLGAEPCWHCGEMNDPDVAACLRCAATLPKPIPPEPERVTVTVEVERPVAIPYVARTAVWPFVTAGALAGASIAIVATLWVLRLVGFVLPVGSGGL